jgi:SAM-dependent methyltransferase
MQKAVRKLLRTVAHYDPDYYDMYADPNETFFARLYLDRILHQARLAGSKPPATVVEAGCQAGRLAIPLAKMGFRVTGIDTSGFALRRAREHAKAAGVSVDFRKGDLLDVLRREGRRYDVVICAEVVYLSPQYRRMLEALAGALTPGGLLCVSHRPKMYYLMEALRRYDIEEAVRVLTTSEGPFGDSAYFNWQTEPELRALYTSLGLQWAGCYPIDRLAWLSGVNPSQLPPETQETWLRLEQELADGGGWGRYVLVIAQRPGEGEG